MRRIALVFALVALFVTGVVPSFAQEDAPTIADIVVASAGGDTPEFTTLLTALQAADPYMLEALSNPENENTVFAPTDAAFAALFEALGEDAVADLLADPVALTNVLAFHVAPGLTTSADVVAALEANDGSFVVPMVNGQHTTVAGNVEDGITIENANIMLDMVDIEANNGIIHVIDAVILPETRNLAEIVVESAGADEPEFTTLLAAVQAADPSVLEALSNSEASLTVFAPTDAAFEAAFEALGIAPEDLLADTETLTNILTYHVADIPFGSPALMLLIDQNDGEFTWTMLNGSDATFTATDEGVFVDNAQIVMTDIDAVNGVIHVIDAVIVPAE